MLNMIFNKIFNKHHNEISVMSYNVKNGTNTKGKDTLSKQINIIKKCNSNIVFLQELDLGTNRSNKANQINLFKKNAGFIYSAFCSTITYSDGQYGIGLLSKHPIVSLNTLKIDGSDKTKEARYYIHAEILFNHKLINVFCTHYPLNLDSRISAAEYLKLYLKENNLENVILGGDFNFGVQKHLIKKHYFEELANMPDLKILKSYLNSVPLTYVTFNNSELIDCIFFDDNFEPLKFNVIENRYSDHNAILQRLRLKN
jgi:endonuclease/exonuclease/phosphatase family metal-dependent hydrolase